MLTNMILTEPSCVLLSEAPGSIGEELIAFLLGLFF